MKKLFIILVVCCAATAARADIMPEPQIIYEFNYQTPQALEIVPEASGQIQCEDIMCMEAKPLTAYGLQKLRCTKTGCRAVSYNFAPYQKLAVTFSDGKTRVSQIFKAPRELRSAMRVNVKEEGLEVIPLQNPPPQNGGDAAYIAVSFVSTILLELAVTTLFLLAARLPMGRVLASVALANVITIPLAWWALADILLLPGIIWFAVFAVEFAIIYPFNRNTLSLKDTAGLVLIMNIASYACGTAIGYIFVSL
ncbi:MAG: hypothetical protein LBG16_02675 [Elusimicrobiota bacterium]|jgi:hypothetical protein|nr:hypothetical protein [Elusimicrobiota bacterium]